MLEYLQKHTKLSLLSQFGDIRLLGLVIFTCIVLLVSWSSVKAIQSNYKLQQQIVELQHENALQELKNSNQKLKNNYYNTPQYLELAARQNFGLAATGEKELLVPKDVAMKYVAGVKLPDTTSTAVAIRQKSHQPFFVENFNAWVNFFLHRQSEAI